MISPDEFKKLKRPHNRRVVDGILPPSSLNRAGSINFQPVSSQNQQNVGSMDNFNRPDGFNPAVQPAIPLSTPNPLARSLPDSRPRRSPLNTPAFPKKRRLFSRRQKKERSLRRKITKRIILTLLLLVLLVGGFLGWKFYKNTSKVFRGGFFGIFDNTKLKGEDQGRVNILLAGNSSDDPGHDGANLTDSIMLISLDTIHHNGFMLSIPRDLWVKYGISNCFVGREGKINAAYVCGQETKFRQSGYPDGAMGLLEKDVSENFGITINYYVKLDYKAFRDAVNAVGGIDVTVKTSDPRGIYDGNIAKVDGGPLKLANGPQHLNGQVALNYARARCDTVCYGISRGDFDRTEHQRQMLTALKDKALGAGVLSNPAKISSLLDAAGNNIQTDFKTNELRRLYDLAKQIQNNDIQSIGLADAGVNLVTTSMINTQSVVIPVAGTYDFSHIKAYLKRITSNDPVVKEGATVVVLNASGTSGLAQREANILTAKGLTVKAVANAYKTRADTAIVSLNNNQKTQTKAYLEQLLKTTSTTDIITNPEAQNYQADFVIILGSNANINSTQ